MSWLAHMVGGPMHGHVEAAESYWPLLTVPYGFETAIYRLVCWVEKDHAVAPSTPLIYVWSALDAKDGAECVKAYIETGLIADCTGMTTMFEAARQVE